MACRRTVNEDESDFTAFLFTREYGYPGRLNRGAIQHLLKALVIEINTILLMKHY